MFFPDSTTELNDKFIININATADAYKNMAFRILNINKMSVYTTRFIRAFHQSQDKHSSYKVMNTEGSCGPLVILMDAHRNMVDREGETDRFDYVVYEAYHKCLNPVNLRNAYDVLLMITQ